MAEEKVLLLKATGISKTYVSGFIRKRRAASLKSVNLEIRKGGNFWFAGSQWCRENNSFEHPNGVDNS